MEEHKEVKSGRVGYETRGQKVFELTSSSGHHTTEDNKMMSMTTFDPNKQVSAYKTKDVVKEEKTPGSPESKDSIVDDEKVYQDGSVTKFTRNNISTEKKRLSAPLDKGVDAVSSEEGKSPTNDNYRSDGVKNHPYFAKQPFGNIAGHATSRQNEHNTLGFDTKSKLTSVD